MIVDMEESTRTLVRAFMYLGCLTIYMVINLWALSAASKDTPSHPSTIFKLLELYSLYYMCFTSSSSQTGWSIGMLHCPPPSLANTLPQLPSLLTWPLLILSANLITTLRILPQNWLLHPCLLTLISSYQLYHNPIINQTKDLLLYRFFYHFKAKNIKFRLPRTCEEITINKRGYKMQKLVEVCKNNAFSCKFFFYYLDSAFRSDFRK